MTRRLLGDGEPATQYTMKILNLEILKPDLFENIYDAVLFSRLDDFKKGRGERGRGGRLGHNRKPLLLYVLIIVKKFLHCTQ